MFKERLLKECRILLVLLSIQPFKIWTNWINYFSYFRDIRGAVLEQSLRKLGVERLSKDDVQKMQWEALEAKIGNWIHYMRIAVRTCHIWLWSFKRSILRSYFNFYSQLFTPAWKRLNCCLLGKGKYVIKYSKVQMLSRTNASQMWLQVACQCY